MTPSDFHNAVWDHVRRIEPFLHGEFVGCRGNCVPPRRRMGHPQWGGGPPPKAGGSNIP